MSRTRRDFLIACSVLPQLAGATARWLHEKPSNWRPDDIEAILNHSAWVREAPLEMDPATAGSAKKVKQGQGLPTDFTVLVRWESGLPVRLARGKTSLPGEQLDHYEVSVSRLPLAFLAAISGRKPGEDLGSAEVAVLLAKSTTIERTGKDPLRAEHAEWINADFSPRISISFPRPQKDPIQLADWDVAVVGRIGMSMFRARFPLRPMVYRGKLEL